MCLLYLSVAWSFLLDLLGSLLGKLSAAIIAPNLSLLSIFAGFGVLGIVLNLLYRKG